MKILITLLAVLAVAGCVKGPNGGTTITQQSCLDLVKQAEVLILACEQEVMQIGDTPEEVERNRRICRSSIELASAMSRFGCEFADPG